MNFFIAIFCRKSFSELLKEYKTVGLDEKDFFALTDIGCNFLLRCNLNDLDRILLKRQDDLNLVKQFDSQCPISLQNAKESVLKIMNKVANHYNH